MSDEKELARKKAQLKRSQLTPSERAQKSAQIVAHLKELPEFKNAQKVMMYVSLPSEVETRAFLRECMETKDIYVPFLENGAIVATKLDPSMELIEGDYGVLEPLVKEKYSGSFDVIVVPGVAFDSNGNRLGFGKGYYDRFLSSQSVITVGLAFQEQLIGSIPVEPHDHPMNIVVTDEHILRCS